MAEYRETEGCVRCGIMTRNRCQCCHMPLCSQCTGSLCTGCLFIEDLRRA